MPAATMLVCVSAFACLAMAMERHQQTIFGTMLSRAASLRFRCAGWFGLAVALWLCIAARGWGLGLVYYSGCTSFAAGVVYCALIAYERRASVRVIETPGVRQDRRARHHSLK